MERPTFKRGWVPSNYERYERFKLNLMHGEDWNVGQKYFAIYWLHIRGQGEIPSAMFENDENHAEINLLRHLTAFLPAIGNGMLLSVTIMQNGSPCSRCSQQYIQKLGHLLDKHRVAVNLVFSAFYRIRRRSCVRAEHNHVEEIYEDHSETNKKGLQELRNAGFNLRTTTYNDWVELRKALQIPNTYSPEAYNLSQRKREDEDLARDLEDIL